MVALEQALIIRFRALGRIPAPLLLHSDNDLVFTSRRHTRLVRSRGLQQEFITPTDHSRTAWWNGSSGH
ncbi:MAG TPA: hypothetical protein PKC34_09925 [Pseudomonadales bacterium]|jgi:putative transposase|nr:hypothetical protein [Pseudomonadales bacterium]HMU89651.1 hypothetical protein [Pseudomonadales bacterium]HMW15848.1 hypothetical protein [Pseudomonadales bacterium]HMY96805.1 hypothetical protein [Pseudomonadales bacterium]HMZ71851.1 hypothetical protein [Pseudomonadales bacterium]